MLPILQVGPFAIPLPSILVLLSIWFGMGQAEKLAPRFKVNSNDLFNLVILGLAAGVVGARLAYAARFPDAFSSAPLSLLTPRPVMMDLAGGVFAGALAALIYGQRKKMPFWPMLDALTPALSIFAVGMALAQLASGDGYGATTQVPWGIELWGAIRHPTQVYAALLAVLIAFSIWPRKTKSDISPDWQPGVTFLTFVALSAAARIFVEAFRGDSSLLLGSIRTAQVAGWIILAGSLWLLGKRRYEKHASKPTLDA